jgi:predicted Zn-dependent protease
MAKSSNRIQNWSQLPKPENSKSSNSLYLYDKELSSYSPEEVMDLALRMSKRISSYSGATCSLTGVLMVLSEEYSIINSHGLEHLSELSSIIHLRHIVEAKKNAKYFTEMNQFTSRRLSEFSPEEEVSKVASIATEKVQLPRKPIPNGRYDLILAPIAVGAFISYFLSPMITGESTQQGVSCFTDMLDRMVAASPFSLIDNGRSEAGLGSAMMDDEGTPTGSTTVIENGVLKNFLYDTLTACLSGATSTGNARRASETLGRTYLTPPEPLPTNLIVRNGDYSPDELIEETRKGVLMDSIDYSFPLVPERGYFNITSSFPALIIENGRIVGHAENLTVSGDLREALMKTSGIGKYARQSIHIGSLATSCPHLRMRDMVFSKSN